MILFSANNVEFETSVTASSDWLCSTLPEVEEPAEWVNRSGQAPIATSPFCLQG